jgi:hypothetical protein
VVKIETPAPEGTPLNDREITASLLASRGWQPEEVDRILAGPSGEPARREEAKAARVKESDAATDDRTAVVNAAQPAKRVQTAKAQRLRSNRGNLCDINGRYRSAITGSREQIQILICLLIPVRCWELQFNKRDRAPQ